MVVHDVEIARNSNQQISGETKQ